MVDGIWWECRCFTSFQVGMSGTDDDSSVLNTGVQLQRIQSLSLTSLYSDASNAVVRAARYTRPSRLSSLLTFGRWLLPPNQYGRDIK